MITWLSFVTHLAVHVEKDGHRVFIIRISQRLMNRLYPLMSKASVDQMLNELSHPLRDRPIDGSALVKLYEQARRGAHRLWPEELNTDEQRQYFCKIDHFLVLTYDSWLEDGLKTYACLGEAALLRWSKVCRDSSVISG